MPNRKKGIRLAIAFFIGPVLACNLSLRTGSTPAPNSIASRGGPEITPTATGLLPTDTAAPDEANWPPTVDEVLAECPTAGEIAEVDSKIKISFETDPTAGEFVCTAAAGSADLTRGQKNVYNAILIMKALMFDAPLPWTDQSLYDWFTGTITAIRFRNDVASHSCCGTPPTISMKPELHAFYSDRWTAVGGLMALYIHEARHTFSAHVCQGRDRTIMEMAPYGVEALLNQWLAYHSDADFLTALNPGPTNDYREASRFTYDSMRRNMFCDEPAPEGLPPALAASPAAEDAVWTEKMIRAFQSGVPVPVPVSPAEDASVPVRGAVFAWQSVDFPGGVTYGIEIDALFRFGKDWEFWQARTDAAGLSAPGFTMPIPFDPSYNPIGRWRVWAISPANGAGPKSAWRYFTIGG